MSVYCPDCGHLLRTAHEKGAPLTSCVECHRPQSTARERQRAGSGTVGRWVRRGVRLAAVAIAAGLLLPAMLRVPAVRVAARWFGVPAPRMPARAWWLPEEPAAESLRSALGLLLLYLGIRPPKRDRRRGRL